MNEEQDATMEFFIRSSFSILVFKIILLQIVMGVLYFISLSLLDLANEGITSIRLTIFFVSQLFQVIILIFIFLRWFYTCYEINDKQITCHKGVIIKNTECYSLEKAESVKIKQGLLGAILKFGTLEISINHSDNRDIVSIKNISRPRRQAKIIEKALRNFG